MALSAPVGAQRTSGGLIIASRVLEERVAPAASARLLTTSRLLPAGANAFRVDGPAAVTTRPASLLACAEAAAAREPSADARSAARMCR